MCPAILDADRAFAETECGRSGVIEGAGPGGAESRRQLDAGHEQAAGDIPDYRDRADVSGRIESAAAMPPPNLPSPEYRPNRADMPPAWNREFKMPTPTCPRHWRRSPHRSR